MKLVRRAEGSQPFVASRISHDHVHFIYLKTSLSLPVVYNRIVHSCVNFCWMCVALKNIRPGTYCSSNAVNIYNKSQRPKAIYQNMLNYNF